MLRVLGLKQERTKELSIEEQVSKIIKQAQDFEICLTAMDYVLDDRPAKGLALIEGKDEAIYKLATGVVLFIEFTLGFEEESRIKAQKTLAEAENLSYKAKNNNEKLKLKTSSIYPPGTEYAVAHAEATLLNALTMLLSESVIDSAKALYKLRRAYYILDEIHKSMMSPDNKKTASGSSLSLLPDVTSISLSSDASNVNKFADIPLPLTSQQKRDAQIVEQCEKVYEMRKNRFDGLNIGNSSANSRLRTDLGLHSEIASKSTESIISTANDPNTSTIDEFIHSGVNLCFGILQVVLS
ncbi:hypothetical protein PACTADRAFT_4857 [Pachysolen tannophilus NRRL Y-2460]|uniref:Uncharacterized protein n=1 Tax=Pachysolen tannophilus NRRL Y-2460 TaxID=669874 RepID=A0A1E4TQC8_PACTA|nr:hypothetical protein PACTADRAFT_4857 [Pachysolen tannophilus NRRL Y-2460]